MDELRLAEAQAKQKEALDEYKKVNELTIEKKLEIAES